MDNTMVSAIDERIKTQFRHGYISAASTPSKMSGYFPGGMM
jgi:hypothetical protein